MVHQVNKREKLNYSILAKKRRPIGRYSGAKRNFQRELELKEPDMDEFRLWLKDLSLTGEEFEKATDAQWKLWTNVEGGLNPDKVKIHWVGQSHLDIAWEWRLPQTIEKAFVTYEKAVFHGKNIPNYCFAGSQAITYEFVRQRHPELFKEIQEAHKLGKFELVGGSWVEPDCRMPSCEAFIRQRLYGQHYFLEHFGEMPKIEWTPDTFGYAWTMPQIIRKSGGTSFFTTKVWGNNKDYPEAPWPYTNFRWRGPDGSEVLTHIQPQMFGPIAAWPTTRKRSKLVKEGETLIANYLTDHPDLHPSLSNDPEEIIRDLGVFYGLGDGGHGPTGKEVAVVNRWLSQGKGEYSTVHKYFDILFKYWDRLPIWNDELYFQQHQGTLTTQGMVKRGIRMLEWRTAALEQICTLLEMLGGSEIPYADFTQVWLDILTNHFHDILPGSSIPEAYDDTYDHFIQDIEILDRIEAAVFNNLSKLAYDDKINHEEKFRFSAINPMAFQRNSIVSIPVQQERINEMKTIKSVKISVSGEEITLPCQFIPGDSEVTEPLMKQKDRMEFLFNFEPYQIISGVFSKSQEYSESYSQFKPIDVTESETEIIINNDNEKMITHISKESGSITSCIWNEKQIFDSDSFVLKSFGDMENVWEIQKNFREWEMDWEITSSPKITEKGPLRTVVEYHAQFEDGDADFLHRLVFYNGMDGIQSEILVDWVDPGIVIKMQYSPSTKSEVSIAEIPGATIKRKINPTTSHDIPRWENNCQTFVDFPSSDNSWGITFINDGKYGFATPDNKFELTLLRHASYPKVAKEAWARTERRARVNAQEYIPGSSDNHWHVIRQWIQPHNGDLINAKIHKIAHGFNTPIIGKISDEQASQDADGSLKSKLENISNAIIVKEKGLEILALKAWEPIIAEDKAGYIIRVINNSNQPISSEIKFHKDLKVEYVTPVDFLERANIDLGESIIEFESKTGILSTSWKPFEVRTFLLQ